MHFHEPTQLVHRRDQIRRAGRLSLTYENIFFQITIHLLSSLSVTIDLLDVVSYQNVQLGHLKPLKNVMKTQLGMPGDSVLLSMSAIQF